MGKAWKKLKTDLQIKVKKIQLTCKSKSTFAFSITKVKMPPGLNKQNCCNSKIRANPLTSGKNKIYGSFPVSLGSYLVYTNWLFRH